jgi:hypothetical protein
MKEKFAIFMTELEILWLYDYTGTGNESNDFTDLMVNRLGKYLVS